MRNENDKNNNYEITENFGLNEASSSLVTYCICVFVTIGIGLTVYRYKLIGEAIEKGDYGVASGLAFEGSPGYGHRYNRNTPHFSIF
jgi:hypothetical protein